MARAQRTSCVTSTSTRVTALTFFTSSSNLRLLNKRLFTQLQEITDRGAKELHALSFPTPRSKVRM